MKRENTHERKRSFPHPALVSHTSMDIYRHKHTPYSAHAVCFRAGLKTEGASESWNRGLEWDYWGRERGRRMEGWGWAGGPSLLFNGRVNKSLVKQSGLQPRVFTALVSITNKSRISPHHHHNCSPTPPACPLSLWAAWIYWEQQIKEPSIWVWSPITEGSCQHVLRPAEKAGVLEGFSLEGGS